MANIAQPLNGGIPPVPAVNQNEYAQLALDIADVGIEASGNALETAVQNEALPVILATSATLRGSAEASLPPIALPVVNVTFDVTTPLCVVAANTVIHNTVEKTKKVSKDIAQTAVNGSQEAYHCSARLFGCE